MADVDFGHSAQCANCGEPILRCHEKCRWQHRRNGVFEAACYPIAVAEPKPDTIRPRPPREPW